VSVLSEPGGDAETELWYRQPAPDWLSALPIGNGSLGALVHGGVAAEVIDLNIDSLWSGSAERWSHLDGASTLSSIRQAVLERRDYECADALARSLQGPNTESYQPLGTLELHFGTGRGCTGYRRSLDLTRGVALVEYEIGGVRWRREAFASFPHRVMVLRVTASAPGAVSLDMALRSPHPGTKSAADGDRRVVLSGRGPAHVAPLHHDERDPVRYSDDAGTVFCVVAGAEHEGGDHAVSEDGKFSLSGADAVTLLVAVRTGYVGHGRPLIERSRSVHRLAEDDVERAAYVGWTGLHAAHQLDHRQLAGRSELRLEHATSVSRPTDERLEAVRNGGEDPGLFALYYHYGRYLLIASSRPGTEPANLQGIWNREVRPPWSSNYTTNINVEMNYWPADAANLAECFEPLTRFAEELSTAGAETARALYGCRGFAVHHNSDLWRTTWPVGAGSGDPVWSCWPMGGVWLALQVYDHYRYSGDVAFLARSAYPVVRSAVRFVLDFLAVIDDGRLVTCPSTSPENQFATSGGGRAGVSAACTMDVSLIHELFGACREAAAALGTDEELSSELSQALHRLLPLRVAADGRLAEWWQDFEEVEPGHRHVSHLYGVFPGDELLEPGNAELLAAARRSLEARLQRGGGRTGWSSAWVSALWARLGEGDLAHRQLRTLLADYTAPNMFDLHPPGVFQIDGNLGAARAIVELLVQARSGSILLLPALPAAWRSGSVRGLRVHGDRTVDIAWDEHELRRATVTLARPGDVTLRLPGGSTVASVHDPRGAPLEHESGEHESGACTVRFVGRSPGPYVLAAGGPVDRGAPGEPGRRKE
jgi:alpha-L-fucosidase 2